MDFYCWTVNGSSLFRIYRDQEYWELMRIALSDFWRLNVVPARELYRIYPIKNPFFEMRSLRPAPRHELLLEQRTCKTNVRKKIVTKLYT
ncbi:hypothetical protein ACHQM5_004781 [Ranunculus cassubicifolius]